MTEKAAPKSPAAKAAAAHKNTPNVALVPEWAIPGATVDSCLPGTIAEVGKLVVIASATPALIIVHHGPGRGEHVLKDGVWTNLVTGNVLRPLSDPQPIRFKLTGETMLLDGNTVLHRIQATEDIKHAGGLVLKGALGGWVQSAHLADGSARISEDAWLANEAVLSDSARISGHALVSNFARLAGNTVATGYAKIRDHATLSHHASASDLSVVEGRAGMRDHAAITGEAILSGDAFMTDDSALADNGQAKGDARLMGRARVCENACVEGTATIADQGLVSGDALVTSGAKLFSNAHAGGHAVIAANFTLGQDAWLTDINQSLLVSEVGASMQPVSAYRTRDGFGVRFGGLDYNSLDALKDALKAASQSKGDRVQRQLWKLQREGLLLMLRATTANW